MALEKLGLNGSTFEVSKEDAQVIGTESRVEGLVTYNNRRCIIKEIKDFSYKLALISSSPDDFVYQLDKALRFNTGKPQWGLVHFASLEPMVRTLEIGAIKYAPNNWMKPMNTRKILESMQRHLAALMDGELIDPETGISHMGNIQCNAMFYNYHINKEDKTS